MKSYQDLYREERQYEILQRIREQGRVSVSDLSTVFGVSAVTVRADLQSLADRNLIVRTHGGAVPSSEIMQDLALASREQKQPQEKERIGKAGAMMVHEGDAVFLDSSSTALAIARHLKEHRRVTVFTNSIVAAQELLDAPDVTVVMPAGTLQRDTASLIGPDGLEYLRRFNIHTGFFGAHGLAISEGLTDISAALADVKRPLVSMCRQVIAVVDATKWGRVGLAPFAELTDIDGIITDGDAPSHLVARVKAAGVNVIFA